MQKPAIFFSSEKFLLWISLAGIALLYFLTSLLSEGTYDSGDGIQHYLISRYSWKHPELFLHHWGKPFFILASSPFTQFGLTGANVFNILCAAGSAFFCFKIARRLEINFPLFAIPILCFAPIYFAVIQSGLTEPFFGFVLVLSIYCLIPAETEEKTGWNIIFSSALASFLPFIRTEGFLILPLFFVVLLYRKKFWAIPLLALGTVVYSVIGYFYCNDLLWILHQNPYKGAEELYGHGKIYHFLIRAEFIWGFPVFLLLISGVLWMAGLLINRFTVKKENGNHSSLPFKQPGILSINHSRNSLLPEELVLIYGSLLVYFFAHVLFWWQGLFSSLGLIRVIAAVMPVSAIISLRGFNFIFPYFRKRQILFIALLFSAIILICAFHNRSLLKLNKEDAVIKQAAGWIKNSDYKNQKIYYLHPYATLALDLDPFDRAKTGELWSLNPEHPEAEVSPKNLLLWDSHFGPNEGRIKLDILINNPSFRLLNKFLPEKEFTVLGGKKFEVYLFERR